MPDGTEGESHRNDPPKHPLRQANESTGAVSRWHGRPSARRHFPARNTRIFGRLAFLTPAAPRSAAFWRQSQSCSPSGRLNGRISHPRLAHLLDLPRLPLEQAEMAAKIKRVVRSFNGIDDFVEVRGGAGCIRFGPLVPAPALLPPTHSPKWRNGAGNHAVLRGWRSGSRQRAPPGRERAVPPCARVRTLTGVGRWGTFAG